VVPGWQWPNKISDDLLRVLSLAFVTILALLFFSSTGFATCTVQATTKTLVLSSASYTYPINGGGAGVVVTYTASYQVNSTLPTACVTPRVITITPVATGGTLASPTCTITLPIAVGPTHLETGSCAIRWTEPASPAATYSLTATAAAAGSIFDIVTSNTLTFNRQPPPSVTIASITNGAEPASNGVLTVTQSGLSVTDTVVALSYGGTASDLSDYTRPASVTIRAGQTTATVTLTGNSRRDIGIGDFGSCNVGNHYHCNEYDYRQ
jgi:hypothetical protein